MSMVYIRLRENQQETKVPFLGIKLQSYLLLLGYVQIQIYRL